MGLCCRGGGRRQGRGSALGLVSSAGGIRLIPRWLFSPPPVGRERASARPRVGVRRAELSCRYGQLFHTDATDALQRPLPHRELHEAGGAAEGRLYLLLFHNSKISSSLKTHRPTPDMHRPSRLAPPLSYRQVQAFTFRPPTGTGGFTFRPPPHGCSHVSHHPLRASWLACLCRELETPHRWDRSTIAPHSSSAEGIDPRAALRGGGHACSKLMAIEMRGSPRTPPPAPPGWYADSTPGGS